MMPLCKDGSGQVEKSMGPHSRQSTPETSGQPGAVVLPAGHGQPGRIQRRRVAARFTRLPLCGPQSSDHHPLSSSLWDFSFQVPEE